KPNLSSANVPRVAPSADTNYQVGPGAKTQFSVAEIKQQAAESNAAADNQDSASAESESVPVPVLTPASESEPVPELTPAAESEAVPELEAVIDDHEMASSALASFAEPEQVVADQLSPPSSEEPEDAEFSDDAPSGMHHVLAASEEMTDTSSSDVVEAFSMETVSPGASDVFDDPLEDSKQDATMPSSMSLSISDAAHAAPAGTVPAFKQDFSTLDATEEEEDKAPEGGGSRKSVWDDEPAEPPTLEAAVPEQAGSENKAGSSSKPAKQSESAVLLISFVVVAITVFGIVLVVLLQLRG
ncbi:MAG: hypothetical protein N2C14_12515, partial [Planctomycetales bacterium]